MKQSWFNRVSPIAAIFAFRMLGLFMLIPIFSVYAAHLKAATPTLIGIALGSYGLTQGLLQIPFGMLSDRYGRKPIIAFGLVLFCVGSLVGALSHSIYGMIIARTLQGAGAIGSVLIALVADVTNESDRTKAMAVIGVTIGVSFSLSMILSPILTQYFGLHGIFYITALLALFGLFLVYTFIPTPTKMSSPVGSKINPTLLRPVLGNVHLQRLNLGIFFQHLILTATFFAIPIILHHYMVEHTLPQTTYFYLPLITASFVIMAPLIVITERRQMVKPVFLICVGVTALSQLILAFTYQYFVGLCILMFSYFASFNMLEATLPSLISRMAGPDNKGTAMGVYSSSQFLGIFIGGASSGLTFQHWGAAGIFILNAVLAILWFFIASFMISPNPIVSHKD